MRISLMHRFPSVLVAFLAIACSKSAPPAAPQAVPAAEKTPEKPVEPEAPKPAEPAAEAPKPAEPAAEAPKPAEPEAPKPAEPAAEAPKPAEPEAPKPAEVAAEAPKPAEAPVAPTPAGTPGPAYVAVDKRGVARIDENGIKLLADSPTQLIKSMQVGPDGGLYIVSFEDIYKADGDKMKSVAKVGFRQLGASPDNLAVGANGELWLTSFKGVHKWDGKAWTTEDKSVAVGGETLIKDIALDNTGRPWVATSNDLWVKDAAGWRKAELPKGKRGQHWLQDLQVGPKGHVFALTGDSLFEVGDDGAFTKVDIDTRDWPQLQAVSFSSNGGIGVLDFEHVHHQPAGGKARSFSADGGKDFKADRLSAVAVDDSGRLWAGSGIGVTIFGAGGEKTEWASGAIPELVGNIEAIVVVGAGPTTLPTAGPLATGGLTGKLIKNGEPMAGVDVELCTNPSSYFKKSPCNEAPVKFETKTDASGNWTVTDMPLGSYGLAVKDAEGWRVTMMSDLGDGMKAGKVYDTGSLRLDK